MMTRVLSLVVTVKGGTVRNFRTHLSTLLEKMRLIRVASTKKPHLPNDNKQILNSSLIIMAKGTKAMAMKIVISKKLKSTKAATMFWLAS